MSINPGGLAAQKSRCERRRQITYWYTGENRLVQCNNCGNAWYPMLAAGGRYVAAWWRCPNRCNSDS